MPKTERIAKTELHIQKRIKEIEGDSRYQSGLEHPATIDTNAPLALIQLSFETEIQTLRKITKLLEGE